MEQVQVIRVLIADDHTVVRGGLITLLEEMADVQVVGEAADGVEAVRKARALKPHVILMDLMMPRKTGIEAIGEIKQADPNVRILILTSYSDDDKVLAAFKAGAMGYLLKETTAADLRDAIRRAYEGEVSLHPTIARKLIRELNRPTQLPATDEPLTDREAEVLVLVARGLSNRDIAESLVMSESQIAVHLVSIFTKLWRNGRLGRARPDDDPDDWDDPLPLPIPHR